MLLIQKRRSALVVVGVSRISLANERASFYIPEIDVDRAAKTPAMHEDSLSQPTKTRPQPYNKDKYKQLNPHQPSRASTRAHPRPPLGFHIAFGLTSRRQSCCRCQRDRPYPSRIVQDLGVPIKPTISRSFVLQLRKRWNLPRRPRCP